VLKIYSPLFTLVFSHLSPPLLILRLHRPLLSFFILLFSVWEEEHQTISKVYRLTFAQQWVLLLAVASEIVIFAVATVSEEVL